MRYANRRDNTHSDVKDGLLKAGFSVADTSRVGDDFPDLLIARNHVAALVEIKTPNGLKTALERRSKGQIEFHSNWKGPIITAYNASDVIHEFNMLLKRRQAWAL